MIQKLYNSISETSFSAHGTHQGKHYHHNPKTVFLHYLHIMLVSVNVIYKDSYEKNGHTKRL